MYLQGVRWKGSGLGPQRALSKYLLSDHFLWASLMAQVLKNLP